MPPRSLQLPPRVVVDCHFFIDAVTLTSQQRQAGQRPPGYALVRAFEAGAFLWTWEAEIIEEYERTASWLIRNHRPGDPTIDKPAMRRIVREIRALGLEVVVPDEVYNAAWDAIMAPGRSKDERDEDDAIYLATAHAAGAQLLLSRDRSITSLGQAYQGTPIVRDLGHCLRRLGFKQP